MRSTGDAPYAVLRVTRVSTHAIAVREERNGKLSSEVKFTASADGQTPTET